MAGVDDVFATLNIPLAIAALLTAVCVQGLSGFGSGLVAVPLLLAAGATLPEALITYYPLTYTQVLFNVIPRRAHINWPLVRTWVPWSTAGIVAGVSFGTWLTGAVSPAVIKGLVGCVICASFISQRLPRRAAPNGEVGPARTVAYAVSSGLLTGCVGMGGPPIVMWQLALGRSGIQMRVMIWILVVFSVPFTLTSVVLFNGPQLLWFAVAALCLTPLALIGAALSARLGDQLGTTWNRRIAWTLLLIVAAQAIATPLVTWLCP